VSSQSFAIKCKRRQILARPLTLVVAYRMQANVNSITCFTLNSLCLCCPCRVLLRIKKKKDQMLKAELQAKVGRIGPIEDNAVGYIVRQTYMHFGVSRACHELVLIDLPRGHLYRSRRT
jgi:hypothetical protein